MTKSDIKNSLNKIKHHLRILFSGAACVVISTLVVGLLAFTVYGFCAIPKEAGYAAVIDFVVSGLTLAVALANMYYLGLCRKTKKKGVK